MYKLSGHSLTLDTFFESESQGLILQERDSTSTITLGPDAPDIAFNDWLMDDDMPGGVNMVWRVKNMDDTKNTETRQIELEHVIKILDDTSLFDEVKTSDISGGDTATAREAVTYLLNKQSDWVLGDFAYNDSNPYEFSSGETLLDAISSVTDTLDEAQWDYDMSVYPFVLHVHKRNHTVSCEMRAGRNLQTLKRSVSRSGMYTRIYPIGKNDLHITGNYISKNENLYGRIDKVETNSGKSTEDSLRAWAGGRLNKHCEPRVSISISGLELYQETGEPLDRLRINTVCQCPLPEFSTTITERIVKLQWRDRKKEPENVTVNLANSSADVATIIKESSRGGGSAAAGQAKQNYLFEANGQHLYYEVFDECGHVHSMLEMTTESLRIAFDNTIASTRSEFLMTSESLRIAFENEIASTRSQFEMTSESLRIQFENELASTRSDFEMTSESLRIAFENEISSARSEFQMTAESLRVSFESGQSSLRSELQMTAESLRVGFENGQSSLRSEFQMTAESLRVSFESGQSSLRSELQMTAESLRVGFENGQSSLRSELQMTAESLRVSFESGQNSLRSELQMTASSLRISFEAGQSSLRSELQMTASSLRVAFETGQSSLRSEFLMTASSLRVEFENADSSLRSSISATAESLSTLYTKTGVNSLGASETLYSKITQNAESITTKVGKGDIASTINQTAQSVLIQAAKIDLDGYVTVSSLDAVDAKIGNLMSGVSTATLLKTSTLQATSFSFNGDAARWGTVSLGSIKSMTVMTHSIENKDFDHYHGITISESDGVITVEIGAAASSAGSDSFNMADTAFYQNAVSAAIASVKVKAANIVEYQEAYYNSTTHNTTVYIEATATNGESGRQTFHVSGADAYAAGEAYADSQYTQVSVTPIKATSAIRIDDTAVTLYEAGSGTKYDRGTGLTAYPVVSSGGTIFYEANAQATYRQAGSGTKYDRGTGLTAYPVVSSGGTIYYEANAQATYRQAGSGTKYDRGTGLTARPVVSSGGTIYYEANAQATYRQAGSGTKYDRGTGLTARPVVSSGGTVFYTAGTAVTRYKAGTAVTRYKGNGGSFTVQGSQVSVTPIKATSAIRLGTRTTIDGKSYYPVVSSGGTIYYQANAATTYYQAGTTTKYARGDSESITPIGDSESITPIGSTSVRLGAAATYYPGDGGAFTPQGAEVVVTPIKATSAIRLGASGTYYPGDGGAFTPQGAEVVVTPIKATSAIRLGASGTYYPGDGGSFTPQGSSQQAYKKLSSGGTIYYQANPATNYYTKNS